MKTKKQVRDAVKKAKKKDKKLQALEKKYQEAKVSMAEYQGMLKTDYRGAWKFHDLPLMRSRIEAREREIEEKVCGKKKKPKVSWKEVVQEFVKQRRLTRKEQITVCLQRIQESDRSGSVSKEELERFFDESCSPQ